MQESNRETLHIAYSGSALKDGRMPMESLAIGLRGQSLLIHRVKDLLLGESVTIRVEVDPDFQAGSLVIPVHIVTDGIRAAEGFLAGQAGTALANLLTILGFVGGTGVTLYKVFKRLKGRRIEKPEDVPDINIDILIEIFIQIYNDSEVQTQLRQTVAPLYQDGIEEFQTRREGVVVERVTKSDLKAIADAEVADITRDEEVTLDIEKVSWRRKLAWHFNDGKTSFDAKIKDDLFWKNIAEGERFADGDRMTVHLRTTAERKKRGVLKVKREIPKVIHTEHVTPRQPNLFGESESN